MPTTTAEFQFAASFASIAVAAAGLLLLVLRSSTGGGPVVPAPVVARVALSVAFVLSGAAALLAGPVLQPPARPGIPAALRVAAAVALLTGSARWQRHRPALLLRLGGVALAGAGACGVTGSGATTVDAALFAAVVLVGASLVSVARASVAARVAAGSAITLIALVLVLSVALGSVITSSLQRDEQRRLVSRAGTEAAAVGALTAETVIDARFAGLDLAGTLGGQTPDPLLVAADGDPTGSAAAAVAQRLRQLSALYPVGGFAYSAGGRVVAATGEVTAAMVTAMAADPVLAADGCDARRVGTTLVAGGGALAAAAYPECLQDGTRRLGTVLRVVPIDGAYLAARRVGDPSVSLALVIGSTVVATAGPQPPAHVLTAGVDANPALRSGPGGRITAGQPFDDALGRRVGTLVASSPTSALDVARDRVLRTLFVVALGGTGLALVLAGVIGDRITAGLRSLTSAAQRVQLGDTASRAGVGGPDEVGVLGAAFDAMVVSIEEQTVALQQAADDEVRLRDRLEAVVAGMGDALVAVDAGGAVTEFNPAAEALTGLAAGDALGRRLDEVLPLVDETGDPIVDDLVGDGRHPVGTGSLRTASGDMVPVAATAGRLVGRLGEPSGSVVVVRDLRGEQEVERMKSEFLSRVGHELRTPLTGILGYADLLVRRSGDLPPERLGSWHGEILGSAKRLLRIVEMLEFFAGSGAGRVTLRSDRLDLRELVGTTVQTWGARVTDGTRITRRVARDTPAVRGDRRWLAAAVDELVDNAVKFSPPPGRIEVRVGPVTEDGGGRWVEVQVVDRGKGMTDEELAAAFTDFAQGDSSDTRAYGGLGLGLPLVQRVVAGQGGTVSCRSVPGRGSTFSIRLPAWEGA